MALWEYKIISSGRGGFGSPALLETHLNQLGKDEWEIIAFHTQPDNPLAFHGLARRTTQRDWTLEDAAASAAKAEAEKLRAEFAAKFQAAQASASSAVVEEKPASFAGEAAAGEDGLRRLRDTDRDQDPEELADDENEEWKKLESEQELPSFFEFIRPHMRRNQRGPGMSLAVDYLANKIDLSPGEVVAALRECDFVIPEREDDDPVYLEYDGDLYWVNVNRHHQLFINTKEKPRPVFRTVKGQPVAAPERPADDRGGRTDEGGRRARTDAAPAVAPSAAAAAEPTARPATDAAPAVPAESGETTGSAPVSGGEADDAPDSTPEPEVAGPAADLLRRLRPLMRRNRRSPGVSGSIPFLSRALRQSEQEFTATLVSVGFILPTGPNDKPAALDVGNWAYWLNQDGRGGLWINGRKRSERDRSPVAGGPGEAAAAAPAAPSPVEPAAGAPVTLTESAVVAAEPAAGPDTASVAEAPAAAVTATAPAPLPEPPAALAPAESSPSEAPVESAAAPVAPAASASEAVSASRAGEGEAGTTGGTLLSVLRARLEAKPRGGAAASVAELATATGGSEADLLAALAANGLSAPAADGDKSEPVDLADEQLWLEKGAKDGVLRLHAKAKAKRKVPTAEESGAEGDDAKRPARKSAKKSAKN